MTDTEKFSSDLSDKEEKENTIPAHNSKKKSRTVALKWNHYILEFFIVALGISVPFLLSKWNENNNLKKTEKQYYINFRQELNEDLGMVEGNIHYNQEHIDLIRKGIEIINNHERHLVDTLGLIAITTKEYSDFHKNSAIYEVLANSGELNIISNIDFLVHLQNLEEVYTYINRLEETHQEVIFLRFLPVLNYVRINPFKVMEPESLFHYQFQNSLEIFLDLSLEKDSLYRTAEVRINNLLISLDKELN